MKYKKKERNRQAAKNIKRETGRKVEKRKSKQWWREMDKEGDREKCKRGRQAPIKGRKKKIEIGKQQEREKK